MVGTEEPPTRREYPDSPIAGVAAIVFSGGKVLLTLRLNEPSRGRWALPGGIVELGETVEAALIREVEEETRLLLRPERLITVFDSIVGDEDGEIQYHYILCEYLCEHVGGELSASSDVGEAKWIPLAKLDSLKMSDGTRRFIKRVAEEEEIEP